MTYCTVVCIDIVCAVFVRAEFDSAVVVGKNIVVSVLGSVEWEVGHVR